PDAPVRNLVALATPIDFSTFGALDSVFGAGRIEPEDLVDETGNVPSAAVLRGIRLLEPTARIQSAANLWLHLADDRYVAAHASLTGWASDHIPLPGAAFRQIIDLFFHGQCLIEGRVPIGDRTVDLGRVTCPVLSVTGTFDHLVPPECSSPLAATLRGTRVDELRFPTGHVGLLVG